MIFGLIKIMKNNKKTISLCMIVKNEERFLSNCLESVENFVDEIIVVDTGSADKTIEIARSFNSKLYYYEWDDNFSNARLQDAPWYFEEDYQISGLIVSENQVIELPYPDLEQGRYRLDIIVQDIDLGENSESQYFFIYE